MKVNAIERNKAAVLLCLLTLILVVGAGLINPSAYSENITVEEGLLIHGTELPETLEYDDVASPYSLMTYIYEAMTDSDDFDTVEMKVSLVKNETTVFMAFTDVKLVKTYWNSTASPLVNSTVSSMLNSTIRLEVDSVGAIFRRGDGGDQWAEGFNFLRNYDLWYSNLTVTQKFSTPRGDSVDVIHIEKMTSSHLYRENSYKP